MTNENSHTTYLEDLTELLQADDRLVNDEGKLLKTKITELAQNNDPQLISLLLSNQKIKDFFFIEVAGVVVFNPDKFLSFVHNEAFLADSYTAYKNKIGLATSRDNYINESNKVVLNWPYKDCALEGGQDKEDQKRDEIFWNETLGADQRDTLLAPKVLTGFKRFDKNGEQDANELSKNDNLIIRGNNLLALYTLEKRYAELVKLIYIDPPYNTGSDSFGYNDKFNHSSWLTFMKNRLEIARKLLSPDGQIYIHIDYIEVGYLRVICDEIFGGNNFVQIISIKTSTASGVKVVNPGPVNVTEFILVYAKNRSKVNFKKSFVLDKKYQEDYSYYITNKQESYENWKVEKVKEKVISNLGYGSYKELEEKVGKNPAKKIIEELSFEFVKENADSVFATFGANKPAPLLKDAIEASKNDSNTFFALKRQSGDYHYILNGRLVAFYSSKMQEVDGQILPTTRLTDFWDDLSWDSVNHEGGVNLGNGKKPESLIKRVIEMSTEPHDIVLDYHLGSGTTASVAHKMNRQYIGIEQLNYGQSDPTVRLQNVIEGDQSGISKSVGWAGGGSFVFAHLKNDINVFIEQVENANDKKELEELLSKILSSNFLSHRVNPKKFEKSEFDKFSLAEQKRLLIELVDKNKLYVNYHDIDDASYKIDATTKKLNHWLQSRG